MRLSLNGSTNKYHWPRAMIIFGYTLDVRSGQKNARRKRDDNLIYRVIRTDQERQHTGTFVEASRVK
jgi:hypothetical protein